MSMMLKMIFAFTGPKTLRDFQEQCRAPMVTQEKLLLELLRRNASAAFGREHRFDSIRTFAEFQRAVPITTYEDLAPYISRQLEGEPAQLTASRPVLFVTTSGTTGQSKYIPVTPESKASKSQQMRTWFSALMRDHPTVAEGKTLSVVSPEVEERAPCGTPCGAESGHAYRNMPRAVAPMYSCPYEIFEISDYDAKYYTILRIACGQSIAMILSPNPSTILLLAERMGQHTEDIIRDVRDGTLSVRFDVSEKIRQHLAGILKPDPARAAALEKAASEGDGILLPRNVWPDQRLIACWKGGNVGIYLQKFDRYFKAGSPIRDLGYYASEMRGSIVLDDTGPDGVLAIGTNLYEFFPADSAGEPNSSDLLRADQLEKGKRYFIYVTTHGGLYRYEMNDIIEVTGFYEATPLIRFIQKGKGVVSFTGEKLYEAQVIAAVESALAAHSGHYEFITAIGELRGDQPQYSFLVEFDSSLPPNHAEAILERIESALCDQNAEYAAKRASGRINPPALRVIKTGEFERYRREAVQNGKRDSQFKTVRLTSDAAFARSFAIEREVVAATP